MRRNLTTGLKRRPHPDPMGAFDRLAPAARAWAHRAVLPWSAASIARIWARALRETGDETAALARLCAAEAGTLARERGARG